MEHEHRETESSKDLSALAWVNEELRRAFETAHKALRRHFKELAEAAASGEFDPSGDTAALRSARQHFHQCAGALDMVGQSHAAALIRANEAAVTVVPGAQRPPLDLPAAEVIERASFAVLDFVTRLLAGKQVSTVALFPQFSAVQALLAADRIHPADLWTHAWQWQPVAVPDSVPAQQPSPELRSNAEALTLAHMRTGKPDSAAKLAQLFASLSAGATTPSAATLWALAAAFFEAQSQGLLNGDVYTKRMGSRILAQLRSAQSQAIEQSTAAERLAHDLLFFCAQADTPADAEAAPCLIAVRAAYGLSQPEVFDYNTPSLGKFDPAWVLQARKRVAGAKDAWSAVAGGELHRLSSLIEQFSLVADSLKRLFTEGESLGNALVDAVTRTVQSGDAPPPAVAMEVATSVLYVDAALEDADFDGHEQGLRVRRLAERLGAVLHGHSNPPLDGWMEELYRRVSDRQTMGSVVQELRSSLSDVERVADPFFRVPSNPQDLHPVPGLLASMRGVLSVLGLDHASAAVAFMRHEIEELMAVQGVVSPESHAVPFNRLAENLGSLGFLIDMLSVQPQLAKSLFVFDAATGRLTSVLGRSAHAPEGLAADVAAAEAPLAPDAIESADAGAPTEALDLTERAELPEPAAEASQLPEAPAAEPASAGGIHIRDELIAAGPEFAAIALQAESATAFAPVHVPPPVVHAPAELEEDDEMRDIFLEEAREVFETAHQAVQALAKDPQDSASFTTLRRAFHTLKGSSRMVGLNEFGEAAWSCEQLYNARIADAPSAEPALMAFTGEALAYLAGWVEAIDTHQDHGHRAEPVRRSADALRVDGHHLPLALPTPVSTASAASLTIAELPPAPEPVAPAPAPIVITDPLPEVGAGDAASLEAPAPAEEPIVLVTEALDSVSGALQSLHTAPPGGWTPTQWPEVTDEELAVALNELGPLDSADLDDLRVDFDDLRTEPMGLDDEWSSPRRHHADDEPVDQITLHLTDDELPTQAAGLDELPSTVGMAAEPAETLGERFELQNLTPDEVVQLTPEPAFEQPVAEVTAPEDDVEPLPAEVVAAVETVEASHEPDTVYGELEATPPEALPEEAQAPLMPAIEPVGLELPPALDAQTVHEAALPAANEASVDDQDQVRVVGPLRISIPLFNIYLNEADEQSRRLSTELAEWAHELHRPVSDTAVALAHSLAGNSATVGFTDLSQLARSLEHALAHSQAVGRGHPAEAKLFGDVAEEIRRLLHQFAAGFLKAPAPELLAQLADHEVESGRRVLLSSGRDEVGDTQPAALDAADADAALSDQGQHAASSFAETSHASFDSASTLAMPLLDLPQGLGSVAPLAALSDLASRDVRSVVARAEAADDEDDLDAVDAVDVELFPIFEEEAQELLPQLAARMREWAGRPADTAAAAGCMRTLHTLKGGARLAGAMRLGELAHRLETAIEHVLAQSSIKAPHVEALLARVDGLQATFEALLQRDAQSYAAVEAAAQLEPANLAEIEPELPAEWVSAPEEPVVQAPAASGEAEVTAGSPAEAAAVPQAPVWNWSRFQAATGAAAAVADARVAVPVPSQGAMVRVRAPLLDRLVNQAGEVSITRSRIQADVGQIKGSLTDLTDNLERLRRQLRDIELQAETQISSRMEAAKAASQDFDPLEFDRYTRFQELTRMMAESVNDLATVQRNLQRSLQSTEDELAAQARLTRDLQDDLLRTRMVEFEGMSERLYRVARQAAKETGKQVRLDLIGGSIEVDRGVLDRMTAAFEHLLRNSVTHGIESPDARVAAGKDPVGSLVVALTQEGNEVGVEFRDDGHGLDFARIRARGEALGLIPAGVAPSETDLVNLIFTPGFSTAEEVSELAGRGVGMDVVRSDVNALGGRIETASTPGQGTSFRLVLPLTTAVTQVVMLRCGDATVAVPSTLIEIVRRAKPDEVDAAYARGSYAMGDRALPFFWLGALLQANPRSLESPRTHSVLVIRSAQQRIALHVDEVLGNQEVVVKNLGPQLSRVPGLAGMTLLASGAVALIYNPVALAALYGAAAQALTREALKAPEQNAAVPARVEVKAPLVLVVDDSLTVRRVTQRMLVREGYRVTLAKDGLEALEHLAQERPAVVLSDIEMPRMDGFDLVRNMRGDARLRDLPVIMITSRIAQKHRDYAAELGVDHYLGKPYSEEDLLALVTRYASANAVAT